MAEIRRVGSDKPVITRGMGGTAKLTPLVGHLQVDSTDDAAVSALVGNPATATRSSLSAAYVPRDNGALVPLDTPAMIREGGGSVLWDSALTTLGDLSAYNVQYPQFASVVNDPILGATRKVLQFAVPDDGTLYPSQPWPDNKPRSQAESPYILGEHDDVYIGFSQLLPAGYPVVPADSANGWISLGEVFGPPFTGSSSNGYDTTLDSYSWGYSDIDLNVQRAVWVDFIIRYKMDDLPGGFIEMWTCSGAAWQQRTFTVWPAFGRAFNAWTLDDGGAPKNRLRKKVWQPGVNDGGWNMHKVSLYRSLGTWLTTLTVYFADHKIGTTWESVKPTTYPAATLPVWEA